MEHDGLAVTALAVCLAERRPLLSWAVEYARETDPLPDAWTHTDDVLSMAVIAAITRPSRFRAALSSIPWARLPAPCGDLLQTLGLLPDAAELRMLAPVVQDAARMFRRLTAAQRDGLLRLLRVRLREAIPSLSLAQVLAR